MFVAILKTICLRATHHSTITNKTGPHTNLKKARNWNNHTNKLHLPIQTTFRKQDQNNTQNFTNRKRKQISSFCSKKEPEMEKHSSERLWNLTPSQVVDYFLAWCYEVNEVTQWGVARCIQDSRLMKDKGSATKRRRGSNCGGDTRRNHQHNSHNVCCQQTNIRTFTH